MNQLRIGCSGWAYQDWKGRFYPDDLKPKDQLAFYASRFNTVELNASFYRLPTEAAVARWTRTAPADFVIAWKTPRGLTHENRLIDCAEPVALVHGRMAGLGPAEGPALLQLPPSLRRDDARLDAFLQLAPQGVRQVVEFRHASWYDEAVFALLAHHNAALCISDHHHAPAPARITANFAYWRGHGPDGRYLGRYGEAALTRLAESIANWRSDGRDVYAYFDNTIGAAAPLDAMQLQALMDEAHI